MTDLSRAASDVLAERARQIAVEGWTPDHDDAHAKGELAQAAACYAHEAARCRRLLRHDARATRHFRRTAH